MKGWRKKKGKGKKGWKKGLMGSPQFLVIYLKKDF